MRKNTAGNDRRGFWVALTVLIGIVAASVAVAVINRADRADGPSGDLGPPVPLGLTGGASLVGGAPESAMYPTPVYEFVLEGELPDLGGSGLVHELVGPSLDTGRVAAWAAALGIAGPVESTDGGYRVTDGPGGGVLEVLPGTGGWDLWYSQQGGGEGAGGSSGSSTGGGQTVVPEVVEGPPTAVDPHPGTDGGAGVDDGGTVVGAPDPNLPPLPPLPPIEPTDPPEPFEDPVTILPVDPPEPFEDQPFEDPVTVEPGSATGLPSEEEVRGAATDLIEALGVLPGGYAVEVGPGMMSGVAVSCVDGSECVAPPPVVESLMAIVTPEIDGTAVAGLEWWLDYGPDGLHSLSGSFVTITPLAEYPLRSVTDVYDDLVAGRGFLPGPMPLGVDFDTPAIGAPDGIGEVPVASGVAGACAEPPPGSDLPCDDMVPMSVPTTVITITGVERGLEVFWGWDGATEHRYVVPTYRFVGRFPDATPYETTMPAVEEQFLGTPEDADDIDGPVPPPIDPPGGDVDVPEPMPPAAEPAPAPLPGPPTDETSTADSGDGFPGVAPAEG